MIIFKTVVDLVRAITNASLCKAVLLTEVKLNAKSRSTKEPIPSKFSGLRKVTCGVFGIGYDYNGGVKNQVQASGYNPNNFTVQKASGRAVVPNSHNGCLSVKDDDSEQFYVQLYKKIGKMLGKSRVFYINPSNEVVEPTKQEIADYFPKAQELPAKQIEAGCDEDRATMPFSPKAESIIFLKKGEKLFDNLNDKLRELLKSELDEEI